MSRHPGTKSRKRQPQATHAHFMCTCLPCGQEFEICGLPCFIFCPGCRTMLIINPVNS